MGFFGKGLSRSSGDAHCLSREVETGENFTLRCQDIRIARMFAKRHFVMGGEILILGRQTQLRQQRVGSQKTWRLIRQLLRNNPGTMQVAVQFECTRLAQPQLGIAWVDANGLIKQG